MTEKKIEKEIEYWSKHLDLDKLNISIAIDIIITSYYNHNFSSIYFSIS